MTIQTDQTQAALDRAPSGWDQRKPGGRRAADLTGWQRVLAEGIAQAGGAS